MDQIGRGCASVRQNWEIEKSARKFTRKSLRAKNFRAKNFPAKTFEMFEVLMERNQP